MWDSFAKTNIHNDPIIKRNCEVFRNLYAIAVNAYMSWAVIQYYVQNIHVDVLHIAKVLAVHLYIDSLFIENTLVHLHHLVCILGLYSYEKILWTPIEDYQQCAVVLYSTEISSVFLCIREIIRHMKWTQTYQTIYQWNNIIFGVSFYFTRILLFSHYFIFSDDLVTRFETMRVNIYSIWFIYTLLYAFFGMNIYWGYQIGKRAWKENSGINI
jgi:hypothetical protein